MATVEFVGGPDCGATRSLPHAPAALPPTLCDRFGVAQYRHAGTLTAGRQHRYDWQHAHTRHHRLPEKCCTEPHKGCPLYLHPPGTPT